MCRSAILIELRRQGHYGKFRQIHYGGRAVVRTYTAEIRFGNSRGGQTGDDDIAGGKIYTHEEVFAELRAKATAMAKNEA